MSPETMTAGQINRALDRLEADSRRLTQRFIDAGRGHERMQEILAAGDPLALAYRAVSDATRALRNEIERRYGPGAPSRLPAGRGFGPIRRIA